MWIDLQDVADHDGVGFPVRADCLDIADLDTGHCELVGELIRGVGDRDVVLEPGDGY